MSNREIVSDFDIEQAWLDAKAKMKKRREQKGNNSFSSRHEALGVIAEEYHEFVEAVHGGTEEDIKEELLDLVVASVYSLACLKNFEW